MAGLASTEFAAAMKTRYIEPLNDNVFRSRVLLNRLIKKENFDMSGNDAVISIISARNPSVGSRADADGSGPKIPDAGAQTYNKATFQMAYHYGRGQVSGIVKRKSRDKAGAFAQALNTEMEGLMESLPDDLNRQVCGDGSGRAATCSAITAHSTQTTATGIYVSADHVDHMTCRIGDRVHVDDISVSSAWGPATGGTVVDITLNAVTSGANKAHLIEISAATGQTFEVGVDALYFGANTSANLIAADSSRAQELIGLQAIIDDGAIGGDRSDPIEAAELATASLSYGGIDRTSNAFWRAQVMHNPTSAGTLRPATEKLFLQAILTSEYQHGGKGLEGYCCPSMWGTIGQIQTGNRIYNDFRQTVEMGFEYIVINGVKIFADRDLPDGMVMFIAMDDIFILSQNGYEMLTDDGNVLRMANLDRDAWQFTLNRDIQLGARRLRTSVSVRDLENTMTVTGVDH